MARTGRSKADEYFAVAQKRDKQALREKEKARQEMAEHVAKLRALRLAKEAADKQAADAEKTVAKGAEKRPSRAKQVEKSEA